MRHSKTVTIDAPFSEVWSLKDELEVVATCIPGLSDYSTTAPSEFDSILTQRVGPVTAKFRLHTTVEVVEQDNAIIAVSVGSDNALGSRVTARQVFELEPGKGTTVIKISADVRVSGRIASLGSRIALINRYQEWSDRRVSEPWIVR